ncbi:MAG: HAD-IA family hydrolase [Gammaproteobacteria bacterium]|nr:HAD-IA family hydrolase [Gammaproteobacteria bacterium]MDH3467823.1 HAD-IA family hydrolase [Gammaproteobacteria bacterium]
MGQSQGQGKVTTTQHQKEVVKVIVVDLGGVLFAEGSSEAADVLSRRHGYDKNIVLGVFHSPESIALRKGLISDVEFWTWVRSSLPERYDARTIQHAWYDGYLLDEDVLELIRQLKSRYTLLVFSGSIKSRVDYLDGKYDFRKYFDQEIYSFDHGLNKPDKAFVDVMLEKAGCKPNEIVYIDDQISATAPAQVLGVKTIIYRRGEIRKLRTSLSRLGVELRSH